MRHLLRRHVMRRAHHMMRTGQRGVRGIRVQEFGDAKVGDLQAAGAVHKNVPRLDVAMHHALVVREL
jgi:hypothetical protein